MATATGQQPLVQVLEQRIPPSATAATTPATLGLAKVTGTITSVEYFTDAAITGANTNTRRIDIINKAQNGAGAVVPASKQFNSGVNAVAFDNTDITLSGTPANLDVNEGDVLSCNSVAVGTGLADPGGLLRIKISRA